MSMTIVGVTDENFKNYLVAGKPYFESGQKYYDSGKEWYDQQKARQDNLDAQTLILSILFIAQMVAYWLLFNSVVDKRDNALDAEMDFLNQLQAWKRQDLPILRMRLESLNIPVPDLAGCCYSTAYTEDAVLDGRAFDASFSRLIENIPGGLPIGWSIYDGQLASTKAVASGGNLMSNDSQERRDEFIFKKAAVVQTAQRGTKTTYTASGILGFYNTATSIYNGLAGIWIQGFNSAGAGLGTLLNRQMGNQGGSTPMAGGAGMTSTPGMAWQMGGSQWE
jgi:hypothetical protein